MKSGNWNIKRASFFLLNRAVIVAVLILLQVGFLIKLTVFWSNAYIYVYWICVALSMLAVLVIVSRQMDPGYKIGWIIPILIFPIFGWLLYLICGGNRMPRRMAGRMLRLEKAFHDALAADLGADGLAELGAAAARQARYLERYAGCPAYTNTRTEYFPLGDALFPRMLEELRKAERFIFLEYFIIDQGVLWDSVLEILREKHAAGVDVRIIYDDVGCLTTLPMNYARKLERETGIPCCAFNRFRPVLSIRMNNRDHRKLCVIDGQTAFTGGVNLADEYINVKARFGHWKDSAILVQGEAVWSMTAMFLFMWGYVRGVDEDFRAFRPAELPAPAAGERGFFVQPYTDSPLDNEPVGETVCLNLISGAHRYVYITTPYLVVSHGLNTALCTAAKSGVDVRIITPHIPDKRLVFELTRAHYQPLLEAGVRIFEYAPGFIHAKNIVVDDRYATVGTVNLDYRSMFLHFENGVLLCRDPAIRSIRDDFLETQEKSVEITLEQSRRHSGGRQLLRAILRVLAPLF